MSVEANKATVRRVADEIFSQGKLDVIDDIFAPHYVGHTQHGTVVHGAAGVKQFVAQYRAAFSHAQSVVEDQVAEGDRVVVRLTFTGTKYGPMDGPPADRQTRDGQGDGALPPPGRQDCGTVDDWGYSWFTARTRGGRLADAQRRPRPPRCMGALRSLTSALHLTAYSVRCAPASGSR